FGLGVVVEDLLCIDTGIANAVSLTEDHKAQVKFTTVAQAQCRVSYGNDPKDLPFTAVMQTGGSNHEAGMNLNNLDGIRDLYYAISCRLTSSDKAGNTCVEAGVIPVDLYKPYYLVPQPLNIELALRIGALLTMFGQLVAGLLAYPRFFLYGFWILKRKEKGLPWGLVFDKNTLKVVPFALVRLYNSDKTELIKEAVTDLYGKYGFVVSSGNYRLIVEHSEFQIHEENVALHDRDTFFVKDVPLLTLSSRDLLGSLSFREVLRENLPKVITILFVFGFLYSLFAAIFYFNIVNFLFVFLYVTELVILLTRRDIRRWGFVYNVSNNDRVSNSFVRVFSKEESRQLDVQMADERGSYGFLLNPGTYLTKADAVSYTFAGANIGKLVKSPTGQYLIEVTLEKGKPMNLNLALRPE
ncbi:MAG TPA: hypothetical protein VJC17_04190, partial [Candidatus Dojkabacteria bacterium]|nr:hypothetical protein [Candidatus Dojkabacteria bacterium]